MKWLPDRKVLSGGIAGVLAFAVVLGLGAMGVVIPMEAAISAVVAIMPVVAYFTPQSVDDILARVDAKIIGLAAEQKPEVIAANVAAIDRNAAIPLVKKAA